MSFKGYVYSIKSLNSNHIYIGSTKQSLSIRYSKHKYDSQYSHRIKPLHRTILKFGGFDNFHIYPLKELTCNSIEELREIEKKVINDYKHNDNYELMNIQYN
jgi:hypothetical protein